MSAAYTVSDLARMARVTVRLLHHYDEIGLLRPSRRSAAGYRLYERADLERLQQILVYRELGFPLQAIRELLQAAAAERLPALRAQHEQLVERRRRLDRVIATVERGIEGLEAGHDLEDGTMFEGLEELTNAPGEIRSHHRETAAAAHQAWGDSPAYSEAARRTKGYGKEQWDELARQGRAAEARMADLLSSGAGPTGDAAMAGAEEMRRHVDRWFYPCDHATHARLADLYGQDPRFRAHYERAMAGLAEYVATAIRANADRARE